MTVQVLRPVPAMVLIGRGVFIELVRRKDVYVLLIMMVIFLIGVVSVSIVGVEDASTRTFLLNLGMTLAFFAAQFLTLLLAARQIPDEIENRTLYPLLAKPVSRDALLLGKWLACAACGTGVLAVLMLLGWLPAPRLESTHTATLLQAAALMPLSLCMVAAFTLALSLVCPKGVVVLVVGALLLVGDNVLSWAQQAAGEGMAMSVVAFGLRYLPDFSKLNLVTRYTDGIGPVEPVTFVGLLFYGTVFTAFPLVLAAAAFRKRAL